MTETVLVVRTCAADMTSHGGFRWPESGHVEAPDWDPTPRCSGGLHGLLWGVGHGDVLSWDEDARWLLVEVAAADVVDLDGQAKFPAGTVVACGSRDVVLAELERRAPLTVTLPVVGAVRTAGYEGTATAGDWGAATAGVRGTATAGVRGAATAGDGGTVIVSWHAGGRSRVVVGHVGEDGILADTPYRVEGGRLVGGVVTRPAACGTRSGYVMHRRRGEQACDDCKAAHAAYMRELRHRYHPDSRPRVPARCGTVRGYERHRRRGEQACVDCKVAEATYRRALRHQHLRDAVTP